MQRLVWIVLGFAAPAAATDYDLYFLAGQSNMEGYGYSSELPPRLATSVSGVRIFTGNAVGDDEEPGGAGLWAPLGPGHGVGFTSNGRENRLSDRFGPELTFAERLLEVDPTKRIAIVKYARGGSSLARDISGHFGDWDPEFPTNNQYDFALAAIDLATSARDIDGDGSDDTLIPRGIVWMQGESDAYNDLESARAYEGNLGRLMTLLREALGVEGLPVVIGKITDSGRDEDGVMMTHIAEVQAAQESFAELDTCAAFVSVTDDFSYPPDDDWHYTSADYLTLGAAFADAIATLERRCSTD